MREEAVEQDRNDISPLFDQESDIDTKELAERIKKRVRDKMASGVYDEDEAEGVAKLKIEPVDPAVALAAVWEEGAVENLNHGLDDKWDVTRPISTDTPRSGIAGVLIKTYKKLFQMFIEPTINISMAKQAEFNSALLGYLNREKESTALTRKFVKISLERDNSKKTGLNQRMLRMENDMEKFKSSVSQRLSSIENKNTDILERVEKLSETLNDVDRQGAVLKGSVTGLLTEIKKNVAGSALKTINNEREKLDELDYVIFENRHRGTREEIKNKLSTYLEWFKGADNVLDAGCGRGELLELFNENGIATSGVDINKEMAAECKNLGLNAVAGDALSYMASLDNNSLGGVTAIQFIEHLPKNALVEFFHLALLKMKPGATLAAETVNPTCLTTFSGAFYLDMTHDKPIHPLAVQFLLERIGFREVRIEYLYPYPDEARLTPINFEGYSGLTRYMMDEYNRNIEKLNRVLYSHPDYAVIAIK